MMLLRGDLSRGGRGCRSRGDRSGVGHARAVEVHVEPSTFSSLPHPGLLGLGGLGHAVLVDALQHFHVGYNRRIVAENMHVRVDNAHILMASV